eukprot:g12493.t1
MKPTTSSKGSREKKKQPGYQVWHFALAVPTIAVTLQLMLGSLTPLPKEQPTYYARYASVHPSYDYNDYLNREQGYNRLPEVEVLPLNLRGEMTGPLLASVLQEYFPQSTTEQAADLRDTLPPCDNPRMIVILPKDDEPVF